MPDIKQEEKEIKTEIPEEAEEVLSSLEKGGFEAYTVGGCVRDLLRRTKPKDWDITTNAKPEEIQKIFPESFYKNKFGTVTVNTDSEDKTLREIEITTYRTEAKYTDKRHPDEVKFTGNLEDDLKRRDFTINAMALAGEKRNHKLIDPFDGQKDLEAQLIRAVGRPEERFGEDALRLMRAVRFAAELDFDIEEKTRKAINELSPTIEAIAKERIKDELVKMILSDHPKRGFDLMRGAGLLEKILPELAEGVGVSQNKHHKYNVYEHITQALQHAAAKKNNLVVRLAALFHDIAKPRTKEGEGPDATFYNHEVIGAKVTEQVMKRLKFSNQTIENVRKLVFAHMFKYEVGEVSDRAVRRTVRKVGPKNIYNLYDLRLADRMGSGVPKEEPYRIRHWLYTAERVSEDPISVKMLKVNGHDVMEILDIKPGPKIGLILNALLSEVIDDPSLNKKVYLQRRIGELAQRNEKDLKEMIKRTETIISEEDRKHKEKYHL